MPRLIYLSTNEHSSLTRQEGIHAQVDRTCIRMLCPSVRRALLRTQLTCTCPPERLYFRLLGYKLSGHCVFSSDTFVGHSGASNHDDDQCLSNGDQWFSDLEGTGTHAGLYVIKGKESGKVLYSRATDDPRVHHVRGRRVR